MTWGGSDGDWRPRQLQELVDARDIFPQNPLSWPVCFRQEESDFRPAHAPEMSADAIICLEAAEPTTIGLLLPRLAGRLNRGSEPRVAVTAADDGIWFRSPTWQPILVARVEDALDELVGLSWPGRYVWA